MVNSLGQPHRSVVLSAVKYLFERFIEGDLVLLLGGHLESWLLRAQGFIISSLACVNYIQRLCHPRSIQNERSTPAISR